MLGRYGRNGVRHARYREGPGTSCQGRMIQLGGGRVEPPHELKDRIRFRDENTLSMSGPIAALPSPIHLEIIGR